MYPHLPHLKNAVVTPWPPKTGKIKVELETENGLNLTGVKIFLPILQTAWPNEHTIGPFPDIGRGLSESRAV